MADPRDDFPGGDDFSPEVVRYVTGECSAREAAELERRMLVDARLAEQVELLRQVWGATAHRPKARDLDRAWTAVHSRLDERAAPPVEAGSPARRFGSAFGHFQARRRLAAVAAAVLAVAIPASALWFVGQTPAAPDASVGLPVREYATLAGERAELRLGDGTEVVLGPGSRLGVRDDFRSAGSREVTLEGQAHFEVVHDERRPFRVQTALGVAEDLGTAFVVTTYPELGGMQVAVTSGLVAIAADAGSEKVLLHQGDLGRLDSAGVSQVHRNVDLDDQLAWTRGELVFRGTPLRQVLPQLERWYGIRVRLASARLGDAPLSASFASQAPDEALAFVAAAVGARLTRASTGDSAFTLHSR
jgi:transmembrane sensor